MAHYPTLQYTQFKVLADSLPSNLRLPPDVEASLPPAYNFELEQKIIEEFEASQAAAAADKLSQATAASAGAKTETNEAKIAGLKLDSNKSLEEKKEKIARMKELTKADDATCSFYLESYGWNLERAVQEYFSK